VNKERPETPLFGRLNPKVPAGLRKNTENKFLKGFAPVSKRRREEGRDRGKKEGQKTLLFESETCRTNPRDGEPRADSPPT